MNTNTEATSARARTSAPVLHPRLALSALSRYPLPAPRLLESLPASTRNDNLLIEDALGKQYVLRRYRRNPDRERIDFQLSLQQHLLRQGLPVSRVIETGGGDRVVHLGDDFWALFTFVPGNEYDYQRASQAREAARWLARFHIACEGFEARPPAEPTIPDIRRWWLDGQAELARLEAMFRNLAVQAELDFLRGWNAQLLRAWPLDTLDTLPAAWVHGDYHGRNLIFSDDRLTGLFDFDVVHRGFRIEDVAFALFALGREHRESQRIRPATARTLLSEYQRSVPLTELERRALPMMASVVQARTAARYALRRHGGEDIARALRSHVGRMRSLQTQMASLATALSEEQ